ncbi:MAG TPA: type III-A CRISPR-associated RAMP protein Csm3 [Bacteroidales bacterium]|nr:type III-A CRISPR-associated RAMP protein Csm3 [Bacteroidales bacterium]HOK98995.1 type III-A CRISPR-associated RAMP protein Csm3 [Bacteroidales bacterium]HPO65439.1 type III-A CRISPR-associated RAMP protein Csm3 [Bacteroidales bacterium]
MSQARKLIKKIVYQYEMELITGLRIGDSKENVEIGGVDAPVVRRKDNQQPYIPGSSIKGKMRCLLELAKGINADSECRNTGDIIQELFGAAEGKEEKNENRETIKRPNIPSRLIVRDAYLTDEWAKRLAESEFTDMPYTEIKAENKINRLNCSADPRFFERIPAGAVFNVEFVVNIFEGDNEKELCELIDSGIKLIELDYLGGSGSRGYGQVTFNSPKKVEYKIIPEEKRVSIQQK